MILAHILANPHFRMITVSMFYIVIRYSIYHKPYWTALFDAQPLDGKIPHFHSKITMLRVKSTFSLVKNQAMAMRSRTILPALALRLRTFWGVFVTQVERWWKWGSKRDAILGDPPVLNSDFGLALAITSLVFGQRQVQQMSNLGNL